MKKLKSGWIWVLLGGEVLSSLLHSFFPNLFRILNEFADMITSFIKISSFQVLLAIIGVLGFIVILVIEYFLNKNKRQKRNELNIKFMMFLARMNHLSFYPDQLFAEFTTDEMKDIGIDEQFIRANTHSEKRQNNSTIKVDVKDTADDTEVSQKG